MPNIMDKIPLEIMSKHQNLTDADKRWFTKYEKIYRRGIKDSMTLSYLLSYIGFMVVVFGLVFLIIWLVMK
jgi:hypothetical protein